MNIDMKAIAESLQWLGWDDDDVRRTVTQLHKGFLRAGRGIETDIFLSWGGPAMQFKASAYQNGSYVDVIFMNKFNGKVWFSCHGKGILQDRMGGTPYVALPDDFDFRAIGYLADKLANNNLVGYQMHLMRTNHYPSWSRTGKKHESTVKPDAGKNFDEGVGDDREGG